jgi:hypothetical protein
LQQANSVSPAFWFKVHTSILKPADDPQLTPLAYFRPPQLLKPPKSLPYLQEACCSSHVPGQFTPNQDQLELNRDWQFWYSVVRDRCSSLAATFFPWVPGQEYCTSTFKHLPAYYRGSFHGKRREVSV